MKEFLSKKAVDDLSYEIIGAAIEVHKYFGAGLLERDYELALLHELKLRGLHTQTQQSIPIPYKGIELECMLRYDILVERTIVVELKSVLGWHPVFEAAISSYMKHLKVPKGILINFNVKNLFYDGQKTFVNEYYRRLP